MNPSRGPPRHLIILVVDDEPGIRRVACQGLERDGYVTLEAENGREALAMLEAGTLPIDLVLSDVRMPDVDGIELFQAVNRRWPGLPVLLMSGEVTREWIVRLVRDPALQLIQKPFRSEDLLATIHHLLDPEGGSRDALGR